MIDILIGLLIMGLIWILYLIWHYGIKPWKNI